MKREFLIEEIIFNGVSGEVRGTIEIDVQSDSIDQIDYQSFCFQRDDIDSPIFLDKIQLAMARAVAFLARAIAASHSSTPVRY